MNPTPDFSDAFTKKLTTGFSETLIEATPKLNPEPDTVSFPDSFSERLPNLRLARRPDMERLTPVSSEPKPEAESASENSGGA